MAEIVEIGREEKVDTEINALYESSMKNLQEGNILKGKVIAISEDSVIVDVGLKSEGKVPLSEFLDREGKPKVSIGDTFEVMIVGKEKEFGLLLLSKQKADNVRLWERIRRSLEGGEFVDGEIISQVKGGFLVDIGIKAFLPLNHADKRPVKNPESFVGRRSKFKVLKVNNKKGGVVVSRKLYLIEEAERKRREFWKNAKVGEAMYGLVRKISDEGALVDLDGVSGFLPAEEISWGRVLHPRDYLRPGDEIRVKIIELDRENENVKLSMRRLKPDPWEKIDEKYKKGSKVQGKVVGLTDYGAFVELEKGVEGLLHVSEISWDKNLKNPKEVLSKGKIVDVMVLDVDKEKRRISLSMKQLYDPWEVVQTLYPPGTVVTGKIKNYTDFGIFVGLEEGIDGLVHISEVSWSRRKLPLSEMFKKGETVKALVLNVDKEQKKFSLSIKRLKTTDPWMGISERLKSGDVVEGYVTSIVDFGIFVEIEEGVEGLVHVSQMDGVKGKKPADIFKIDEKLKVRILNVDEKAKKIALSLKGVEIEKGEE
ncbi:MAG: 30S ribosomal protein S1 [Desulfobacterota bacterium]|nr:30S ribosomal protein S1 [Thermodesulfobacteriota bacterium]MDW8001897.1 30S ribosomal protein S1 [Deltaproteobacteria bacterium]